MAVAETFHDIFWGAAFANTLEIAEPLDDLMAGRVPIPGSEGARTPSGETDAYVPAYDYILRGTARWIPEADATSPQDATGWNGATGWRAFLEWALEGNAFRFVPNRAVPGTYVDDCYFVEPTLEQGAMPTGLEDNGDAFMALVIRSQDQDFGALL